MKKYCRKTLLLIEFFLCGFVYIFKITGTTFWQITIKISALIQCVCHNLAFLGWNCSLHVPISLYQLRLFNWIVFLAFPILQVLKSFLAEIDVMRDWCENARNKGKLCVGYCWCFVDYQFFLVAELIMGRHEPAHYMK